MLVMMEVARPCQCLLRRCHANTYMGLHTVQVLDFGWIDTLPDGTPCLGNWWPDTKKFPRGLKPLSDEVHAAGMLFGIHMALPQV